VVKTLFLLLVITLLLTPMAVFLHSGSALADSPFKYPGPWEYEEDVITVACGQIHPVYGDTEATLEKMKKMVIEAAEQGANIVLFGEMVLNSCNYAENIECRNKDFAEPLPGPSSLEIAELTKKYGIWVVYGFLEKGKDESDPSKIYNSVAIIGPEGAIGSYSKMHPGFIEDVERGLEPVSFDTPWGPVGISICLDTYGFPELARSYGMNGCRLLLNPTAAFEPGGMYSAMFHALRARIMENWFFIASANRVGPRTRGFPDCGGSLIIGPKNMSYEQIIHAGPASRTEEELLIATLNLRETEKSEGLAKTYRENPRQGTPDFRPQLWADLWGTTDEELEIANEQLEETNNQLNALQLKNKELSQKASSATQTVTMLGIVAGILLLAAITFGILALRKKKK